jgi:hypothetical protein
LNVYVCDPYGLLRFAIAPDSDENKEASIASDYLSFEKGDEFSLKLRYNLGRTGPHEIEHSFLLSDI